MGRKRQDNVEQPDVDEQQEAAGETTAAAGEVSEAAEADDTATDSRVEALEREAAEWRDRCLRQAAEADNLRRRTLREAEDAKRYGNERLVGDLLPVLDNLARALDAASQTDNFEALKSGVEQIYRQLDDLLSRSGLTRITSVGEPFDPNLHEAIMQVEPEGDQEPGQVVEELRAGYRLNDRVVRPSLVKVTSS
ncbi:MAG: co-chaperone GrpE [Armatimonadetes bacterium]|jgi:molecular chaperone GrpE|nr:co-chaperone GrpE [Armatimonadota bacterium]